MDTPAIRVYEDRLGPSHQARGGEYEFDCPFCHLRGHGPDRGHHLGINLDKKKFNCFRCESGGELDRLHRLLGIEVTASAPETLELRRRLFSLGKSEDEQVSESGLPEDYLVVNPQTIAYHYLTSERGLTAEEIGFYGIGYGVRKTRGRVIIPTFNRGGRCVYWVARKYSGNGPTYLNPPSPRKWHMFNLDKVEGQYSEVIICEGVFSAITAGKNAVATFGKGFTQEQVSLLSLARFARYYVAYDDDARKEALELCSALWSAGCTANLVDIRPGEGDPDDMGRGPFLVRLAESEEYDPQSALKIRLNGLR